MTSLVSQSAGTAQLGSSRSAAEAERANRSGKTWYMTERWIHSGIAAPAQILKSWASGVSRWEVPRALTQSEPVPVRITQRYFCTGFTTVSTACHQTQPSASPRRVASS